MFPVQTTKVLKEWATVLEALKTGEQILLFRKGGIIEAHDEFQVESPEFFFYPTYLHQNLPDIQPRYQSLIAKTEAERAPLSKDGKPQVTLSLFGRVEKVLSTQNIDQLVTLTDEFIWTPGYVEKTWAWKPEKPAYVLLIRVYSLETPHLVEERPEYGGCVSWVDLTSPLAVGSPQPVISDEAFEARIERIERILGASVVTA